MWLTKSKMRVVVCVWFLILAVTAQQSSSTTTHHVPMLTTTNGSGRMNGTGGTGGMNGTGGSGGPMTGVPWMTSAPQSTEHYGDLFILDRLAPASCKTNPYVNNTLNTLRMACNQSFDKLRNLTMNQSTTAAQYSSWLSNECSVTKACYLVQLTLAQSTEFAANRQCFFSEVMVSLVFMEQDCRPLSTPGTCFHKLLNEFRFDCNVPNMTSCVTKKNCLWVTSKARCEADAVLISTKMCEDPCIAPIMNTKFSFKGLEESVMTYCLRVGGKVCYGPLASTGIFLEPTNPYTLQAVCSSDFYYQCHTQLTERKAYWERLNVQQAYIECMQRSSQSNSYYYCGLTLNVSLAKVENDLKGPRHFCSRSPSNQWCYQYVKARPITKECEPNGWPMGQNTCPSSCNDQWVKLYSSIGCCFGTIHQIERNADVPANYTPQVPNANMGWSTAPWAPAPNTTMDNIVKCSGLVSQRTTILTSPCPKPIITSPVSDCATSDVLQVLQSVRFHCGVTSNDTRFAGGWAPSSADIDGLCASPCAQQVPAFNKYRRCFPEEQFRQMNEISAMCAWGANRVRCGTLVKTIIDSIGTGGPGCGRITNATACRLVSQCRWYPSGLDAGCQHIPTNETIKSVCSNCTKLLLEALPSFSGVQAGRLMRSLCLFDGPDLCFPVAEPFFYGRSKFGVNSSTLSAVCPSPVKMRCLRMMLLQQASNLIASATFHIAFCAKNNVGVGQNSTGNQGALVRCVNDVRDSLGAAERFATLAETLCLRNAHRWCLDILSELENTDMGMQCLPLIRSPAPNTNPQAGSPTGTSVPCSSACITFWATVLANPNYTCCLGPLHQVLMGGYLIRSSDFPTGYSNVNSTSGAETAPTFTPPASNQTSEVIYKYLGTNGLNNLVQCSANLTNLQNRLRIGCNRPRGNTPLPKKLALPIAFSVIRSNVALIARLVESLTKDISTQLGLPPSDIANATLVENTAVKIQVRVEGSERGFRTLDSTSSGASFTFDIISDSDSASTNAASSLDALVSSGDINLENSASVLSSDCPTCLAAGATSLSTSLETTVGSTATDAPTTSGGSATATSIMTLLVSMLVVLTML